MYRVYKNKSGKLVLPKSVMMTGTFGTRNVVEPNWAIANGLVLIGKGVEGKVYAAFANANMKNLVAIKNFDNKGKNFQPDEYFSKSLAKFIPEHVPNVRYYLKNSGYLVSNMYRGGSVLDWLKKNAQEIDDNILRSIILQVVGSLHRVSLLDPSFRHNDLHLGNVFIDDRYFMPNREVLYKYQVPYFDVRAIIADFGYAVDKTHPLSPSKESTGFGIVPGNDKMYDTHLFINALLKAIEVYKVRAPETVAFLERAIPADYRGQIARYVNSFRLMVGVKYPKSFDEILGDRYFKDHLRPGKPAAIKRLNLGNTSKKKAKSPAKKKTASSPRVGFSKANKNMVALRKITYVRNGMNNVQAEMKAIKNIETLKKAGLLTPSPSGNRVLKPVTLGPAVAAGGGAAEMNKKNLNEFIKKMNVTVVKPTIKTITAGNTVVAPTFTRSPGGRIRMGSKLCMSLKKDELVAEAKKAGVSYAGTKTDICNRLLKGKGPASPARPPARSPAKASFAVAKSPGGRIRIGRKLCMGFKKEELVAMAMQAGVSTSGTKEDICSRLVKGKGPASPAKSPLPNLRTNIKGFINRFPANQTLTRRKIREYIYGRHGNVNNNTFKALVRELTNKKSPPRRMKKLINVPSEIM